MPIWKPAPVDEVPELVLVRWMLIQLPDGNVHAVGWNTVEGEGRVSSPLKEVDTDARCAVSRSGRRYVLRGPPGHDSDALYVFQAWLALNRLTTWEDVTALVTGPRSDKDETAE